MTLLNILNTPIAGNAYGDQELMNTIHNFALDPNNSWQERSDALNHMQLKVMGCPMSDQQKALTPQRNVESYIEETE
jgi:hypothetical protein